MTNLSTAHQGLAAAEQVTAEHAAQADAMITQALAQTNQQASKAPPWEVTFTERRT
jgi:hypothetical protein